MKYDQLTLDNGRLVLELPDMLTEADAADVREFLSLVIKREDRLARQRAVALMNDQSREHGS